ncbi:SMI1/KNR4 family protein [Planktomarina temperata]|nr:SMI1/KNR4 family protein [Planktomarina temperata]
MDFAEIPARLQLPSLPKEAGPFAWDEVERELGIELPTGYKTFVSAYGTGSIGAFLWVFNPTSKNRSLNSEAIRYFQSSYEELKQDFPADYTRPTFPLLSSFLPWAVTDNGDTLVWIVDDGPADKWRVGVMGSDQVEEEISELDFVEFVVDLLDKKVVSRILPKQFLEMDKSFKSLD